MSIFRRSRVKESRVKDRDTVEVPNPWGLGDGEQFVLPRDPTMSEVFARTEKADRYKIFFSYLYHPDPAVRLATLVEGKRLKIYLGENQAVVDKLADSSSDVRTAAALLIWDSPTALEFALRCLSDEINRTGWTSTMTHEQAHDSVEPTQADGPSRKQPAHSRQVSLRSSASNIVSSRSRPKRIERRESRGIRVLEGQDSRLWLGVVMLVSVWCNGQESPSRFTTS